MGTSSTTPAPPSAAGMPPSRRVLLIEDSRTQAELFRVRLVAKGLDVTVAGSAEAGFAEIAKQRPDVILVDYHLPGRNGAEFCREIKSNVNTRAIPVVMLTSEDSDSAQMRGLESGADDYVSKSSDTDILASRIQALLRESGAAPAAVLQGVERQYGEARILAVDDSLTYLGYIAHELRDENYKVDTIDDPHRALELVKEGRYDCVLVDFQMPGLEGPEFCREVRRSASPGASTSIILIMLSGHEDKGHIQQGFEAGADDYVPKSADTSVIRARIAAPLRRKYLLDQNRRILDELREREVKLIRAQAEREAAEYRALMADQLAAANLELENANRQLDRANHELEEFAYSIGHDLQEPLRMIGVYSQMLQRKYAGQLDAQAQQFIGFCVEGARRMDQFIKDLLTYAQATRDDGAVPHEWVDFNQLAANAIDSLAGPRRETGAVIDAGPLPTLYVDGTRFQQVVQNLIANAIKYRKPGVPPHISISSKREADGWLISIRDNGLGVEPEHRETIFALFKRVQREGSTGTGLGLAICRGIVTRRGGSIWVESQPGEGSVFHFFVPDQENAAIPQKA